MGKLQSVFGKANFQVVDNSKHLQPEEAEKIQHVGKERN